MRVREYEIYIYETIHIPTRGEQQDFIKRPKSFVSCSHMNCCLQKYTTHLLTFFIYYSHQEKFKNPRIIKIHQVHQKLQAKQF